MLYDGHVLRSVAGSEPSEVVVEDDVEYQAQAILDAPVRTHGAGERHGIEAG